MTSGTSSVQEEIKEVEQELQEKDFMSPPSPISPRLSRPVHAEALEAGASWKPKRRNTATFTDRASGGVMNLLNLLFSPVFVQTFVMTFLGEWGDRSQIATITLAAASGKFPPPPLPVFALTNGKIFGMLRWEPLLRMDVVLLLR